MLSKYKELLHLKIGLLGYILLGFHIFASSVIFLKYEIFFHEEISLPKAIFAFIYFFLSIIGLYHFVNLWTYHRRFLKHFLNFLLLFLYIVTTLYSLQSNGMLDFFIVRDEIDTLISDVNAQKAVYDRISPFFIFIMLFFITILVFIDYRFKFFKGEQYPKPLFPKRVFVTILYLGLLLYPSPYKDAASSFIYSVIDYYILYPKYEVLVEDNQDYPFKQEKYSYTKKNIIPVSPSQKPHVFLLIMESLNTNVVESHLNNGREYTPYLNRLIKQGLYIENFYGNSVRSCNGLFSIFSSLLPPIKGKATYISPNLNFQALPAIFARDNYHTIYFQAYKNLEFDKLDKFLIKNKFSEIHTVYPYLTSKEREGIWGWGPEDIAFYKGFFRYLDQNHKVRLTQKKQPYFMTLATVSNHYPYNVPPSKRYLFKEPQSIKEKYANSIYLSDKHLKIFFKELKKRQYLKNSLIIITSDHAYPVGGHGIKNNELGFYEESFRIPFVMIWENKISPQRISSHVFSQIDIAPTLVDLLKLPVDQNHFQGVSMQKPLKKSRLTYLVQPYNGRYISVVDYPFKYIKHLRTGRNYLFNIESDQMEEKNLLANYTQEEIMTWDKKLEYLFLNQYLIEENKIWQEVAD